jgi:3-methyladenine DNA glycosylase AlkD
MDARDFIAELSLLERPGFRLKMAGFGIPNANALGIPMPVLRDAVKPYKGDASLALDLFESEYHEAKMAAGLIFPPKNLNLDQADYFMDGLYSWDLVDQFCGTLFQKASFARELPFLWSPLPGEFQRRSGLVMILVIAIHHKKLSDQELLIYLPLVKEQIDDERNFVKKANSWVLRTLGKRSPELNKYIVKWIEDQWQISSGRFRYWAAADAWRELTDPKITHRLQQQAARRAAK